MLSELRPGVVLVETEDGASEKYFIPGGFAFTHANGTLDISAPEGCKLDDIDVDAFKKCARVRAPFCRGVLQCFYFARACGARDVCVRVCVFVLCVRACQCVLERVCACMCVHMHAECCLWFGCCARLHECAPVFLCASSPTRICICVHVCVCVRLRLFLVVCVCACVRLYVFIGVFVRLCVRHVRARV